MIQELLKWLVVPALLTMALIGGIRLTQDIASYSGTITGTAFAADCTPTPGAMFNDCASLDATQIEDLR